jgi:hypothetical protein
MVLEGWSNQLDPDHSTLQGERMVQGPASRAAWGGGAGCNWPRRLLLPRSWGWQGFL